MKIIMNIIFMIIATTMAIALTITTFTRTNTQEATLITGLPGPGGPSVVISPFPKRASRFLAETKNPRAAAAAGDNCKKDDEVCNIILDGKNSTCCGNKCMDLSEDKQNCGACKNKCKFTSSCCRGECVSLAYDKRHCGACGNKCMPGGYCIYGLCNYA